MENSNELRQVMVPISIELLISLMYVNQEGIPYGIRCIDGMPLKAKYVGSFTDNYSRCGFLVFEHESFEPVKVGQRLPIREVVLQRITKEV